MSRIGKKPIEFDKSVEIVVNKNEITVKGPKGTLNLLIDPVIKVKCEDGVVLLERVSEQKHIKAKHGLYRSLLANMIHGVTQGFSKELELNGVGYRVQKQGTILQFSLGFSHPVTVEPPQGIQFEVTGQNKVTVFGIDKYLVGQIAAKLRKLKAPDPYKGKGIKYVGEKLIKKQGKGVKK